MEDILGDIYDEVSLKFRSFDIITNYFLQHQLTIYNAFYWTNQDDKEFV